MPQLTRRDDRHWLLNGPAPSWRWPVWLLDELLDRVPRYIREDGIGWQRKGCWGCYPLRLHRWWMTD